MKFCRFADSCGTLRKFPDVERFSQSRPCRGMIKLRCASHRCGSLRFVVLVGAIRVGAIAGVHVCQCLFGRCDFVVEEVLHVEPPRRRRAVAASDAASDTTVENASFKAEPQQRWKLWPRSPLSHCFRFVRLRFLFSRTRVGSFIIIASCSMSLKNH